MAKKKTQEEPNEIGELIRKLENDYTTGTTTIGKYVEFSQYENIEKITAYLNSKHISGDVDSLGREKPFFNISIAARNIWYRATDIDRKNIRIKAARRNLQVPAYAATLLLQEWMRRENFGAFLNAWGLTLAGFGSAVLKFVEKNGELIPSVIPWNRIISDTIDFDNNPVIETLWLTPAQLRANKLYNQDAVKSLLDSGRSRETQDGQPQDNKSNYIKVYELHGNMELSYITGKESDDDVFVPQMHVICFEVDDKTGRVTDYSLYSGKEKQSPYMITHLLPEDGRAQSVGAIEYLFEAQWMTNHSQKLIKDQLDLAGRLITQTADANFAGQNILASIETGDILVHAPNSPLTRLDNRADITSLQNFGKQWEVLAQELTSTPDAMRGENQPAGTAWRQVEALRQESHSLFEQMVENKSLDIEKMMRLYVIPFLKKQLDTPDEIAAILDAQGIQEFDAMYVPNEAIKRRNEQIKKTILSGEVAQNLDPKMMENDIKAELATMGQNRFVKPSDLDTTTWKEALKDLEWEVIVDASGEETDRDGVLTTLTTVFKTIASNPAILQDPNAKMLFNKILDETGAVSPLEFVSIPPKAPQPMETVGGSPADLTSLNKGS